MADNFKCSGDCIRCSVVQRQYCASQNTYNTMKMLEDIRNILIESMKKEEDAQVFSTIEVKEEAQKGSGAKEIDSQEKEIVNLKD